MIGFFLENFGDFFLLWKNIPLDCNKLVLLVLSLLLALSDEIISLSDIKFGSRVFRQKLFLRAISGPFFSVQNMWGKTVLTVEKRFFPIYSGPYFFAGTLCGERTEVDGFFRGRQRNCCRDRICSDLIDI